MIRSIIWTVVFSIVAALLQSTVLARISFLSAVPDLALCVIVFSAYVNGTMTGQVSGFLSGLFSDFLSAAPLGTTSLVRLIIGALTGIFKDSLFLGYVVMPVILCSIATILKALLMLVLHFFMGNAVPAYSITDTLFWIEMGLNALCAPLLFLILRNFRPIYIGRS